MTEMMTHLSLEALETVIQPGSSASVEVLASEAWLAVRSTGLGGDMSFAGPFH
jgi:hypothetical protein